MQAIGIDYQVVFPTALLALGMHPDPVIETQMAWAYSRWLTEEVLPHSPRLKTMIYLPMNQPEECVRFVEQFGERPGVVGFMVTSARYRPVHANEYMPLYAALEERGLPLSFHAIYHQTERMFEGMNRFLSVHALGFIFYNLVHMTNMVVNGIPERFPRLKLLWIESGLAWIPFLMQRLDNEYMMRSSEAPLLRRRPSEYMREMYYTTQPIENGDLQRAGADDAHDQRRDAAALLLRLSPLGLQPAEHDLGPALPYRDGQAAHPGRQRQRVVPPGGVASWASPRTQGSRALDTIGWRPGRRVPRA